MFKVNPKINLYEGTIDIFVENEKDELQHYVQANLRALFEGFKNGECEQFNEFVGAMQRAEKDGNDFAGQMMMGSFKNALVKATFEGAMRQLKEKEVKLPEPEEQKLFEVVKCCILQTFKVFFIKLMAEKASKEEKKPEEKEEGNKNGIEIKIV